MNSLNPMYSYLNITGNSMEPLYSDSDIFLFERNYQKLEVGDVIIFYYKNSFVVHRIILSLCGGRFLVTKGDNNMHVDSLVRSKNVIGKIKDQYSNYKTYIAKYSSIVYLLRKKYGLNNPLTRFYFEVFKKYLLQIKYENGR